MLSINTNLPSLIIQNSLKNSTLKLNQAVERMSTGYKINNAKDNAANFSITTNMSTKIEAYQIAEENTSMGLDLLTTAGDSLELINDKLNRLRALAEQSANGTYGQQSLKAINAEANAIIDEIVRTQNNTEYNGINLFGKSDTFIKEVSERDTSQMTSIKDAKVDTNGYLESGTYSISSAEELQMISNYKLGSNVVEFVLANDLDLSGYAEWNPVSLERCTFDGNGHVIYNLSGQQALFDGGYLFKNLGVENANIKGNNARAIIAYSTAIYLENCYATGSILTNSNEVGGLTNETAGIDSCWTNVNITNTSNNDVRVGGLVGSLLGGMKNSYSTSNIKLNNGEGGGLAGFNNAMQITNCYFDGTISATQGSCYGLSGGDSIMSSCYVLGNSELDYLFSSSGSPLSNCYYSSFYEGTDIANGVKAASYNGKNPFGWQNDNNTNFNFQVGINGDSASQINLDTQFNINAITCLRGIGNSNGNYLAMIDNMTNIISAKQTEYGAAQNRLESALDEISTQYDNLVSSRSTLRDADIAEVSSEYIRQQILQQASATLLSTANQTPALALQLL